ncbi:hypothetical protein POTG_00782 [Paenibacillus sp. oral taxon 786 str. D14]|nr:hypothetical protein POTG_00782 [Paenibacillus sp. oral taxon 786 str. D14]
MLQTDQEFELISYMSKFDMDEDFYNEALEKAVDKRQSSGQFSLDGSRWIYNVRSTDSGYILVFLDVTARKVLYVFRRW